MPVLLAVLKGPMQSWGASSRFMRRETEMMPTKSGVIGMVAGALGMERIASLDRFKSLRFGVRIDQRGTLLKDYHTVTKDKETKVSQRFYLQDAVFLIGLESPSRDELECFQAALGAPFYPLYLGRRSCPPDGPIRSWIIEDDLEHALAAAPWQAAEWYQRSMLSRRKTLASEGPVEIIVETKASDMDGGLVDTINDEPVRFDPRLRLWNTRSYRHLEDVSPNPTVSVTPHAEGQTSSFSGDEFFDAVVQVKEKQ
ncbi:type I-E CRISPR-associated protein Cas5/CasD [Bifidobacterium cuniculi]|uniref:CRISPR-associated protein Cas5 family n=1 Tax=Bifidobacterium cuniculi TaxID=1688 RepID=A0A087AT73_9BIFI|nr:type I-E CRISPR-associated protein Cas5/CasD [Bifidobacterium cuniculi]KFI61973.1 CRISPR-associated protein Cas5 family [Bifidobacterium cuniculi]